MRRSRWLDVVPGNGQAHVVIRRVCEALDVSYPAQIKKLRGDPSATVAMIATVAESPPLVVDA